MRNNHPAALLPVRPIMLKKLILETGIVQTEMAKEIGCNRSTFNLTINRGYIPQKINNYKVNIDTFIADHPAAQAWLKKKKMDAGGIWEHLEEGEVFSHVLPAGTPDKIRNSRINKAMIPGDPNLIDITVEVEMIRAEVMKHFKLFRNPFIDDVQKDVDIFMSDEHRYIEAAMLDAARHSGFLAVIGEVGSGKSIMRRKVIETLRRDEDVLVIYPQIVDKERVTASSLCDAIIMDISDQRPKMRLEQKTRQVQKLLLDKSRSGFKACIIIEEAHDLSAQTLKYLKRFYELEDGYKKLLGIVLIGQSELKHMFNESMHVDMREVIRRCQVAEIKGLNGSIKPYLEKKFGRLKADLKNIIDDEAIKELSKRLTTTDRNSKSISHAFPLSVNNYMSRAMNLAYEMGEEKITAEIMMEV